MRISFEEFTVLARLYEMVQEETILAADGEEYALTGFADASGSNSWRDLDTVATGDLKVTVFHVQDYGRNRPILWGALETARKIYSDEITISIY